MKENPSHDFQSVTWFVGKQKQNKYCKFERLSKQYIHFSNLKKICNTCLLFRLSFIVSRFRLISPNIASVVSSNEGYLQPWSSIIRLSKMLRPINSFLSSSSSGLSQMISFSEPYGSVTFSIHFSIASLSPPIYHMSLELRKNKENWTLYSWKFTWSIFV